MVQGSLWGTPGMTPFGAGRYLQILNDKYLTVSIRPSEGHYLDHLLRNIQSRKSTSVDYALARNHRYLSMRFMTSKR